MIGSGEGDDNDLFLVDCGVEALHDVYLNLPKLRSLNLHSNYITRINNLTALPMLTNLDLSSNQITRIEGLKFLSNLKHLNLSCNLITIVEGLTSLRSLATINLSYNQIISLGGLRRLPSCNSITTIQLQGNSLTDLNQVLLCLRSCKHLSCVVLQDGPSASNPLCSGTNCDKFLREQLPSLKSTKKPAPDATDESISSDRNPTLVPVDSNTSVLSTPRIDAVLDRFHKALDNKQLSSAPSTTICTDSNGLEEGSDWPEQDQLSAQPQDEEMKALEEQLKHLEKELLKKKIESTELELEHLRKGSPKKSETETSTEKEVETSSVNGNEVSQRTNINNNNDSRSGPKRKAAVRNSIALRTGTVSAQRAHGAAGNTDMMYRDAVSSTYQQLMKDLDIERLRRQKAEEAASKLAQQLKSFESETNEQQLARRNCDDGIRKLKKELVESKGAYDQLVEVAERLQAKCKEMESELRKYRKTCTSQEQAIGKLEHVQGRLEQLKAENEAKLREESERLDKTLSEQSDLLRAAQLTVKSQRVELEDMKSLLASREADHRRDMDHRYTLNSPKLEELFQSKITSLVREQSAERREYESRLEQSSKEYVELEDEFRLALQIEAERFQSLKTAFEDLSSNQSNHEKLLLACKEKDLRANKMITDLTQLVKEQKDRILSLSKEKQEANHKMQGTKSRLEQQVENLNNKIKDHERLKRDNIELKNQVQGQHSIISGLRKERELWSKELAQQGASLSSERGTLEAKLETLTQENKTLRSNFDTEVDTVKIKTKLISDLTDTVSTLKQKVGQLETEIKDRDRQLQLIKESHLKELEEERNHCADLEQEVEMLVKRKEELKDELQSVQENLQEVKESHKNLKGKWQEKSTSISMLEDQVKLMRDGWLEKERKLTGERDKAIQAADLALQRMKSSDDGFRKQLEVKELSQSKHIREMTSEYELRIAEGQHRVESVEEEMRELLLEKEQSKRNFDNRMKRLSEALIHLQQEDPSST